MTDFKDWPPEAQERLLADVTGYDRARALQRTLRRRDLTRRILLSLAVAFIVNGFVFTLVEPLLGIPMLVAAGLCVLLGKTE